MPLFPFFGFWTDSLSTLLTLHRTNELLNDELSQGADDTRVLWVLWDPG